jgi:hypothetical protein
MTALILHSRTTILLEAHLRRPPCEPRFYVSPGIVSVMYITVQQEADCITRMFWAGEEPGASGPIDNIRRMPA